jgi:glycosyltransferase involved in cell wall biosynthesis
MNLAATILIPTTGDRGKLLRCSVGSVLNQTVKELEVFIVGDGVAESSKKEIAELVRQDGRVRFFDFPKSPRRGELYRGQLLKTEARGRVICYLCDRDLMLPNHVERVIHHLQDYDFAGMYYHDVPVNGQQWRFARAPLFGDLKNAPPSVLKRPLFVLSSVGHTLEFYKKLPFGWRETPMEYGTDNYMWKQFLAHPECRGYSSASMTFLYFHRGFHPGWPVEKRLPEIEHYYEIILDPSKLEVFKDYYFSRLVQENQEKSKALILIRGAKLSSVPRKVVEKFLRFLKNSRGRTI